MKQLATLLLVGLATLFFIACGGGGGGEDGVTATADDGIALLTIQYLQMEKQTWDTMVNS